MTLIRLVDNSNSKNFGPRIHGTPGQVNANNANKKENKEKRSKTSAERRKSRLGAFEG
jgi:hypothetical protein